MWKFSFVLFLCAAHSHAEDVRLVNLDPPEAQQLIDAKDTSLKYAPKIESNVPAVRYIGNEPQNVQEDIYLANQYHGQDGLGGYLYGYSVPDIAKTERKQAGGDLRGAYNYISGDGQEIKVEYWDDGTGFHQIDNVPKILPQQIEDSPEVKAAKDEHARIWAAEAERNSKPIENPYPNTEPGAYAGLGAGVGAGVPNPRPQGQFNPQAQASQTPASYHHAQQAQHGIQGGGVYQGQAQGGYQGQTQQGHQGLGQQGGYQGQQSQQGQQPSYQHGAQGQQGYQGQQGQQVYQGQGQHGGNQGQQPQQGQHGQQGYQGQQSQQGYQGPQGQQGQQGHQGGYQGQQNQQGGQSYQPGQHAFGQGQTQQQGSHNKYPSANQGQFGQQAQRPGQDYAGQHSEPQNNYAPNPQQQQQQQQNAGGYDDGEYKSDGNEGAWHDDTNEQPTGPPKGFFYNFDYPVGIIVSKQGGAQGGASLPDTYQANKSTFEQQLKAGAAVHGAGSYPSYQVHS